MLLSQNVFGPDYSTSRNRVASDWHRKEDSLYATPKDSKKRLTTWSTRKDHRVRLHFKLSCILFSYSYIKCSQNQMHNLAFSKILTTDQQSKATKDPSVISSAGTICVEYSRIKSIRETRITKEERYKRNYYEMYGSPFAPETNRIEEDSKKAATHLSAAGYARSQLPAH